MKKLLSLLLAMMLVVSLAACGSDDAAEKTADDAADDAVTEDNAADDEDAAEEADDADAEAGDSADLDGAEEFLIGGMGPLTGAAASYGISVKQGAEIAIAEINAAGGVVVDGTTYKLVMEFADDEASEDKAVTAYNSLVDKDIQAFMGAVTSGACLAVTDLTAQDQILQITPSGSAKDITNNENVFRLCFTDPLQGEKMAEYIADTLGLQRAAVIFNNADEYSYGIKDAFVEAFEAAGGEVVANEAFTTDDVDFKTQLTSIKNTDAEIIFVPAYYQDAAYITQQAVELEIDLPFVGSDGWDGVLDTVTDAAAVEGAVFLSPFLATDPDVADFVSTYEADYGSTPDQFAADGYDTIYVFKAAMEQAGSIEYADLAAAMTEITVDGLTGSMKFDETGEPDKDAKFVVIENGEYTALQ